MSETTPVLHQLTAKYSLLDMFLVCPAYGPHSFPLLPFPYSSLSHNNWSNVGLYMRTGYTISSPISNHHSDRLGHAWLPAIFIMSELRQYNPSLRVFKIKQIQNSWIFMGDIPRDFAILQSEPKLQQVSGKNVRVSLPSYHSAHATRGKVLVFKGGSIK